jgi:putative tributyrin esterase
MIEAAMRSIRFGRTLTFFLCIALLLQSGCAKEKQGAPPDHPRLTLDVILRDITLHSSALDRDMQYRVIRPNKLAPNRKLPVVYLLHGGGGGYRDWSNYSDVARYAERGLILVMPEGDSPYYTNSAERPRDRYEDYIIKDLIADVESRFPASIDRSKRAIVGVSMGGFGAVKLGLKYPELFSFVGAISPALDVPSRPFSIQRISQWRHHRSIFGPWNGPAQHSNDPFLVVESADPAGTPYIFLSCGEQEGLLPANRRFARLLEQRHFRYEFHTQPGGHDWKQWNQRIPECFQSLLGRLDVKD